MHLLRYQDAAEKAVRAVIPTRPQVTIQERRTGRQITEKLKLFQELLGKSARLDGDSLVLYLRNPDYIPSATPPAPADGRYRVRVCASAVGTGGRPLPMMCVCRATYYDRDDTDVRTVRDVPAGEPAVIEEEFDLRERQVMVFAGWSLPDLPGVRARHKDLKLDADPGRAAGPGHPLDRDRRPARPLAPGRLSAPLRRRAARAAVGRPGDRRGETPARRNPPGVPDGWWVHDPLVPAPAKPREDAERLIALVPAPGLPPAGRRRAGALLRRSWCTRPSIRAPRSPRR